MVRFLLVMAFVTMGTHVQAGLYPVVPKEISGKATGEGNPFSVSPEGLATELPFDVFRIRLAVLMNAADANPARSATNTDRKAFLDRLALRGTRPMNARQAAGLAADWLVVGRAEEAVKALVPYTRDARPEFLAIMNLAHTYATRGEWDLAARYHEEALFRTTMPDDLPGTTIEQRKWLTNVERRYVTRWIALHRLASATKPNPQTEEPFDLFKLKFQNDVGTYEAGKLAEAEKKKLPADAIAIVQQMVLWAPWDTGLLWLLAELYTADGKVREADVLFFQCVDGRQYSNRAVLMAHRAVVRDAVANLPKDEEAKEDKPNEDNGLPPLRTVLIVVGAFVPVAVLLLVLQIRSLKRKLARKKATYS